ncbi:phage portal protein [Plantibacter sp. CFBP 8798]|uniref:phage portal protein n=1 Tax=Plantibacter sp. CFBP 8798 TaxID=2775268 RepID=UPI00177BB64B|nr:phage portal protein [Plantibacter sp. CFBP 8798]MBD8466796.1 phage portal protein [Plantibacter sp. CFBP 8798]
MGKLSDWFFGPEPMPSEVRAETPLPSDPPNILPPSRVASPRAVGQGDALGLSMVFRAVQIHAAAAKQLSLKVYRDETELPTPTIIKRPSLGITRSKFVERVVVSLAVKGNAYLGVHRNDRGIVDDLTVWNPHDVLIDTTTSGRVTGYQYLGKTYSPDDVKHLSLMSVPGSPYGLGPIQAAQAELRGAIDLRDYSSNWFEKSPQPTGILKSDQVLNSDAAAAAKEQWEKSQAGTRGVAVMGQGLSYEPVFISPADALWIEAQSFTVTQIARLFGVPSSIMLATVEGNSQTYQNVEQDWLGYLRFSLMSYLTEIEDALSELLPGQQTVRFNVEALLRADTTTRYAAHKVAIEAGFMSVAEVRKIENLPALDLPATEPKGAADDEAA